MVIHSGSRDQLSTSTNFEQLFLELRYDVCHSLSLANASTTTANHNHVTYAYGQIFPTF